MDFLVLEALVSDPLSRTEHPDGRRVFHSEMDGLRCCGKATIAEALRRAAV
jgi:hypothetical protein